MENRILPKQLLKQLCALARTGTLTCHRHRPRPGLNRSIPPEGMSILDTINPSLTRYRRDEPAPVLPLRDEPDLLSLLEASGRLVADEETAATDVSTVEEEELSALMGEKEDYNQADDQPEEDWED